MSYLARFIEDIAVAVTFIGLYIVYPFLVSYLLINAIDSVLSLLVLGIIK